MTETTTAPARPDSRVDPRTAFEERVAQLRAKFLADLPDRLDTLTQARRTPEGWGDVVRLAHGLVGSGGTFGFAEIGEAARDVERLAKALQDRIADAPMLAAKLDRAIAALQSVAAKATGQPAPWVALPVPADLEEATVLTIVLLEDDPDQAQEIVSRLAPFGYAVEWHADPDGFIDRVATDPPAALLVDIMIGSAELGPRVAAALGLRQPRQRPPTLFLSARSDMQARLEAVRAGCDAYLAKPVDIGQLVARLDQLIRPVPPEPYRVLLVDDDRLLAQSYSAALEAAGMLTRILNDPLETLQTIADFAPDILVTDLDMPGCDGLELAAVLRQVESLLPLPILFLSAATVAEHRLAALRQGSDDFLSKPIALGDLVAHVSARAQRSRGLRTLMVRDGLTGLLNHAVLHERLGQEVARAARDGLPLAFAMIDIDRFKAVNDTHGHPTGDAVIKSLARLLQKRLRRTDIIGRFGGEEFAVILPRTTAAEAHRLLEGLRDSFAAIIHRAGAATFQVTFSAGVADLEGDIPGDLVSRADARLYRAKRGGRNRTVATD